jgi:hypothetical protein
MLHVTQKNEYANFLKKLKKVSDIDMAWFAGWLCADGSIKIDKGGGTPTIKFVITDKDPLDRIAELLGNTVHGPMKPTGLGKKMTYSWSIRGIKVKDIINRCYKHLSNRYKEKADIALKYEPKYRSFKLSRQDVIDIKKSLKNRKRGDLIKLVRKYNVSRALINGINSGKFWANDFRKD